MNVANSFFKRIFSSVFVGMPKTDRKPSFAFVILVAALFSTLTGIGILEVLSEYPSQQAIDAGNHQIQNSDTAPAPDYDRYALEAPVWGPWHGLWIERSDTLAQWIMAVFTIFATVVLVLTLRSADKTNAAAVRAAEAAVESNRIMQEEQRPWIFVEWVMTDQAQFSQDLIRLVVKNLGSTPARSTKIKWGINITQPNRPDKPIIKFPSQNQKNYSVFRHGGTLNAFEKIPAQIIDQIKAGQCFAYVGVAITYKDAFGRTRRTISCHEIGFDSVRDSERIIGGEYGHRNRAT